MLWSVLGWLTVVVTILATVGVVWWLWIAAQRPWRLLASVHVPREVPHVQWVVPEQDNPIPWI